MILEKYLMQCLKHALQHGLMRSMGLIRVNMPSTHPSGRAHIARRLKKRQSFINERLMWAKPAATEMRFGLEATLYLMNKSCALRE
ncbi:pyrroloquinoline quinone precursor peptide PqqA [Methylophilus aquaticus]|uniref:Coenzyme PQQ synthesis protein A n=1 Tax=Methylophilus aquaticus TaxID=1971610 RepID=A0ABT9JRW1_9PROT|nr:pyrroloquinoline quinone precursor peptide PqqA [Methylophilus aquaticus]